MKNKFRILSLISALAIGATMSLTACGDTSAGDHDHIWDDGTVTTESTCYAEGKRTYNCKVEGCEQTKTEPIAKIAHSWNGGEVTKQAKCNEEGVKTYTCTVEDCGKTKEEPIEKTEHKWDGGTVSKASDFLTKGTKTVTCLDCETKKTEAVEAHADFAEQFSLTAQNSWHYGVGSVSAQGTTADFTPIEQAEGEVWKSGDVEIGKGYVSGDNAAIAYTFTQDMPYLIEANVAVSFEGDEDNTRFNAYLIYNGMCVETVTDDAKDWTYATEEPIDIEKNGTLCIIFKNAGEGKAGGKLSITVTAPCIHVWNDGTVTKAATCTEDGVREYGCVSCDKTYTEEIKSTGHHEYDDGVITKQPKEDESGVKTYSCKHCDDSYTENIYKNFRDDFELNENGEFAGWSVGVVNYIWDTETFEFTKITALNGSGDAYNDNTDGWKEIKGDWMALNGMMGFAYHFDRALSTTVEVNLHCTAEDGSRSLRWAITDKDGNYKHENGHAQWGAGGHDVAFKQDISVENGDVLYLLVNKDAGGEQCTFDITMRKYAKLADFRDDFTAENQDGAWGYGRADYHWGDETFDFIKSTTYDNGAWKADGVEIKEGWINAGGMATIAYTATADIKIKAVVAFVGGTEDTRLAVRIGVKNSSGILYGNPDYDNNGKVSKELNVVKTYELKAGDTIYFIFSNENGENADAYPNGELDITITEA